jgi:predicted MFS family arabinose efflux permease
MVSLGNEVSRPPEVTPIEDVKNESLFIDGRPNPAWLTVLAGMVGLVLSPSPLTVLCFGVFVGPLRDEFGWTLGQTTLAATLITYTLVLISPLQGYLIDRFGSRRFIILSIPLFTAAFASLYFLPNNLSVFYALWVLITLCSLGIWPLSYLRATASWFDRRLGLSLGITNSGVGIGNVIVPPLASLWVAEYGWRLAYVMLAGLAIVLTLPLNLAWLKDRPADGQASHEHDTSGSSFAIAWRSPTFATIAMVFFLMGGTGSGLFVMQVPMLIEAGMKPTSAAGMISVIGLAMIIGRIGTGYLLDLFHASRVLMSLFLAASLAAAIYAVGITPARAPVAAVLLGLGIGAEFDGLSYIIPRYFGRDAFGKIYGAVFGIFQLGSGAGIAAIGFSRDRLGSFRPSMWAFCGLTVIAAVVIGRLGPYRYRPM